MGGWHERFLKIYLVKTRETSTVEIMKNKASHIRSTDCVKENEAAMWRALVDAIRTENRAAKNDIMTAAEHQAGKCEPLTAGF